MNKEVWRSLLDEEKITLISAKEILKKAVEVPGCISKMVSTWDIAHAKPADARPVVRAYWKKEIENGMYWYACSQCGGEVPKTRYKADLFSPYCPHCGATMTTDKKRI